MVIFVKGFCVILSIIMWGCSPNFCQSWLIQGTLGYLKHSPEYFIIFFFVVFPRLKEKQKILKFYVNFFQVVCFRYDFKIRMQMKRTSIGHLCKILGGMINLQKCVNYSSRRKRKAQRKNDWEGGGKGRQKFKILHIVFPVSNCYTKFYPFQHMHFSFMTIPFCFLLSLYPIHMYNTHTHTQV